ncbi:7942_t:CDS:2 [Dentiscutata erythropus]|uniref:7942_t:CDS:1 n=1 Tax=Dentiscutata erythropus TaxID=1348616 RepID=A0A9N9IJG5_9GLOM|nr:7942_t:CDS:2 [Dentiscutata erythropus]
MTQRVRGLVDTLPVICQAAFFQVQKAQNRQKQLHDRKIQNITEFGIGEKVLVIETLVFAYYLSMLFVTATPLQKGAIRRQVTRHYYLAAAHVYDVFAPLGVQQIYSTTMVTFNTFRLLLNEDLQQLVL